MSTSLTPRFLIAVRMCSHCLTPTQPEYTVYGAIALAGRLAEQRVRTTLEVWPHMFHVWHMLVGHLAQCDEACGIGRNPT